MAVGVLKAYMGIGSDSVEVFSQAANNSAAAANAVPKNFFIIFSYVIILKRLRAVNAVFANCYQFKRQLLWLLYALFS
jgi:hypothetical protein